MPDTFNILGYSDNFVSVCNRTGDNTEYKNLRHNYNTTFRCFVLGCNPIKTSKKTLWDNADVSLAVTRIRSLTRILLKKS